MLFYDSAIDRRSTSSVCAAELTDFGMKSSSYMPMAHKCCLARNRGRINLYAFNCNGMVCHAGTRIIESLHAR